MQPGGRDRKRPAVPELRRLPAYIAEYNRILLLTAEADPEVAQYFQGMNLGAAANPASVSGITWKYHAETAAVRLNSLASYLKSKLGLKEKEYFNREADTVPFSTKR